LCRQHGLGVAILLAAIIGKHLAKEAAAPITREQGKELMKNEVVKIEIT